MKRVIQALAWFPAFYFLWGCAVAVWTTMLIAGWIRRDKVALQDCFLRHIARRDELPARIQPEAIRRIASLADAMARRAPGVVSDMDVWRILGLCSLFWLLQRSWRLPAFHILVLLSPVFALALAIHASLSHRRLHTWYGRPANVLVFAYTLHRRGLTPREFHELRLHEDERRARADDYATGLMWLFDVALPCALAQDVSHLQDKQRFDAWARSFDASVAPIIARFKDGVAFPTSPELPPRDLFSKENGSSWGSGAELWRFRNRSYQSRGAALTNDMLVEELRRRTRVERGPAVGAPLDPIELLLQERVVVHPALDGLSSATPSCRIVTLKAVDAPSRPSIAMVRASANPDAVVDNFNARNLGAFVCAVDVETGRLGPGYAGDMPLVPLRANPRTGFTFDGITLPFWKEALALCCRLHDISRVPPEVGWDVAFTATGPLLLEANVTSDHAPLQAVNGTPYGQRLYRQCLAGWIRPN